MDYIPTFTPTRDLPEETEERHFVRIGQRRYRILERHTDQVEAFRSAQKNRRDIITQLSKRGTLMGYYVVEEVKQ